MLYELAAGKSIVISCNSFHATFHSIFWPIKGISYNTQLSERSLENLCLLKVYFSIETCNESLTVAFSFFLSRDAIYKINCQSFCMLLAFLLNLKLPQSARTEKSLVTWVSPCRKRDTAKATVSLASLHSFLCTATRFKTLQLKGIQERW